MQVADAVAEFTYAKDHTPATRRFYAQKLGSFCAWCDVQGVAQLADITTSTVRRFIAELRETPTDKTGRPMKSQTLHGYARAVKCFLRWCADEDLVADVTRRIEMPKLEQKVIATFTPQHIAAMLKAASTPRDAAIVAVLLDTGIRANELCTLTVDAVSFSPHDAYITVAGKGRKSREVGLGQKARLLLHRYIHAHRPATALPYVFVAKGNKPLHQEGLHRLLVRIGTKAGVKGVRLSPHTFRHSFASLFIETSKGDIYRLSRILGHTNVRVTELYLRSLSARTARQAPSILDTL